MPGEILDIETMSPANDDWRAVADDLAGALLQTMVRNPTLTTRAWQQGQAALQRYQRATGGDGGVQAVQ